ncbi:MAG: NADP-dependent oxidoreductase [Rhodospirillaceae bacterium]|nr:NADP-dependent oxidoreductase [Rhodospirillaceae bacterium]|tara:strand:+ start:1587 stop:2591 length:1005 start_codon:yes stop_codon:yes gene_type:complete
MNYRSLGASGLKVSPLCLGTMIFGSRTDEPTAGRIVGQARDAGINFIDTADAYNAGETEKIVGRIIKEDRDRWVLATKMVNPMGDDPHRRGASRKWVMQAIEESLTRLGTDYVDIYYLHKEDLSTPLDETVRALGDLIRAGKIRYFGLSNYRAWRHAEVIWLCRALGVPKPVVSSPYYNAMNRMPEVEILPACGHYEMGVVPYSPVARGMLTGKYKPGAAPDPDSRAGLKDARMMQTEFREESMVAAQKIVDHARTKGMTPVQFACAWVLKNPLVTATIAGPRTEDQMKDYLGTLDVTLDADDEALVDGLVAPGHPSTPGYNDPAYPLEGRPVG